MEFIANYQLELNTTLVRFIFMSPRLGILDLLYFPNFIILSPLPGFLKLLTL